MRFCIYNRDGTCIPLSYREGDKTLSGYNFVNPKWRPRIKTQQRYNNIGLAVTGDQLPVARELMFRFTNNFIDDAKYREEINKLVLAFDVNKQPLFLQDEDNGIRCQVVLKSFTPDFIVGAEGRVLESEIVFSMISGVWEDVNYTYNPSGAETFFTGEDDDMKHDIMIGDPTLPVYTDILIEGVDGVNTVNIENTTNNSKIVMNISPSLTSTDAVYIIGTQGKVYKDDIKTGTDNRTDDKIFTISDSATDITNQITDGAFLTLQQGDNEIETNVGTATSQQFKFRFKKRTAY